MSRLDILSVPVMFVCLPCQISMRLVQSPKGVRHRRLRRCPAPQRVIHRPLRPGGAARAATSGGTDRGTGRASSGERGCQQQLAQASTASRWEAVKPVNGD